MIKIISIYTNKNWKIITISQKLDNMLLQNNTPFRQNMKISRNNTKV